MKKQEGVTLVVLAITIIVLMIITGVVIVTQIKDNGQIDEFISSAKMSFDDNIVDGLLLLQTSYTDKSEYLKYLRENEYIDGEGKVNTKKVIGSNNYEYGKGDGSKDTYFLTEDLDVLYYDKEGKEEYIQNIGAKMEE